MIWLPPLVLAALMANFGEVRAQDAAPPEHNANIWNGKDHQPTREETVQRERRVGVLPKIDEARREQQELDSLYRQLERGLPPTNPQARSSSSITDLAR